MPVKKLHHHPLFERRNERRESTPIWLLIYSDLMTNLMLFFLMLFGLTQMGGDAWQKATKSFQELLEVNPSTTTQKIVFDKTLMEKLSQQIEVTNKGDAVKIVLRAPVLFDSGQAELKTESATILHEIANNLRDLPNEIIVEGYTDSQPLKANSEYSSNWELSTARAENVVRFFVHDEGFLPNRFAISGYGENRPVDPANTPEARAKNRRIEITIPRIK